MPEVPLNTVVLPLLAGAIGVPVLRWALRRAFPARTPANATARLPSLHATAIQLGALAFGAAGLAPPFIAADSGSLPSTVENVVKLLGGTTGGGCAGVFVTSALFGDRGAKRWLENAEASSGIDRRALSRLLWAGVVLGLGLAGLAFAMDR